MKPKKPAPSKPQNRGWHGREKPLDTWNSSRFDKVLDELVRLFYYTFRGYEGPHPWGLEARPPYPEYRPLRVRDEVGGAAYRALIQQHLNDPRVKARFLRTLFELRSLLREVDPSNPRLKKKVVPYGGD